MNKSKSKSLVSFIFYILLIIVLIGMFGFLTYFVTNFNNDKSFYISQGKTKYVNDVYLSFENKTDLRFDIKYKSFDKNEYKWFDVKVIPYAESNFNFTVDSVPYAFSKEKDYTDCFDLKIYDSYFTINTNKDMTDILKIKYPKSQIEIPVIDYDSSTYFTLVVTSDKSSINMNFKTKLNLLADEIIIDKRWILF